MGIVKMENLLDKIFKAYDIRGIVGTGFDEETARDIGKGLAYTVFKHQSPIVISKDARSHSEKLTNALIQGLNNAGCSTIEIGLASTPMNYWANIFFKAAGSVQVTASHNGPEYNGFKVSRENTLPVGYDDGLKEVLDFIKAKRLNSSTYYSQFIKEASNKGNNKIVENSLHEYMNFMQGFISPIETKFSNTDSATEDNWPNKKLKLVVDCGNGMAGHFMPLFEQLNPNLKIIPLYWELDGNFPNHPPDPTKEVNLQSLKNRVLEEKADFGVAFDGDADRCVFIDENGVFISGDLIIALFAEYFSSKKVGEKILYDLRSSAIVSEFITEINGIPIPCRVGHSYMKKMLREEKAIFGGELSGHYYFADCFNTDSALRALIQLINILRNNNKKLSELIQKFRKYFSSNEVNFKVFNSQKIMIEIEEKFSTECVEKNHLDGLSMRFQNWWFNLRQSNTEPLLRLTLESSTKEITETQFHNMSELIQTISTLNEKAS
jgi:phosphomannomutase